MNRRLFLNFVSAIPFIPSFEAINIHHIAFISDTKILIEPKYINKITADYINKNLKYNHVKNNDTIEFILNIPNDIKDNPTLKGKYIQFECLPNERYIRARYLVDNIT